MICFSSYLPPRRARARQAIRDPCDFTTSDTHATFFSGHEGSPGLPSGRADATYFTRPTIPGGNRPNVANGQRANMRVLVNDLPDGNPGVSALNDGVLRRIYMKSLRTILTISRSSPGFRVQRSPACPVRSLDRVSGTKALLSRRERQPSSLALAAYHSSFLLKDSARSMSPPPTVSETRESRKKRSESVSISLPTPPHSFPVSA